MGWPSLSRRYLELFREPAKRKHPHPTDPPLPPKGQSNELSPRCNQGLTDSKIATPLAPIFPLGVTPRPPIKPAHRSLKERKKPHTQKRTGEGTISLCSGRYVRSPRLCSREAKLGRTRGERLAVEAVDTSPTHTDHHQLKTTCLRMSPYKFGMTRTSKRDGSCTI